MRASTRFLPILIQAALAASVLSAATPAAASILSGGIVTPAITAGAPPDSPVLRIDPNLPASPYSGVVSINIRYDGQSFICSGALVGRRSVLSAGHCVDTDGNGTLINLNTPGADVRVVFNSNGNINALMTAVGVSMHPDYAGFGNCPAGVSSFCVNDDVAVITLGADAPASAKVYKVATNVLAAGTHLIMAGYGTSGTGVDGFTVGPSFTVKRSGENHADLFDRDDEQDFSGGPNEVYYADFDGGGQDTFCHFFGVCSPVLPNHREAGIGGGDSGGPAFVQMYGELMVVANNTFTGYFDGQVPGTFGTYFGGVVLGAYADYLYSASAGDITLVPEPDGYALFGLGVLALLGARCRRRDKLV
jgi:MYXO-CTERM domain-containing protein